MKDNKSKTKGTRWIGITRSPEEDIALVSIIQDSQRLTLLRFIKVMVMSLLILGVYIVMNRAFFPRYPVITAFAEKNEKFVEHYPPFRMEEWDNYTITEDIISGRLYDKDSLSLTNPVGFPLLASFLTRKWGESGLYYTNAFILWVSALVFFFLMLEMTSFTVALASTLALALATPNLFYASSAFPEPASQMMLVLSVFFFTKGIMALRKWIFYGLCGFTAGLNLFFQLPLAFTVRVSIACKAPTPLVYPPVKSSIEFAK